MHVMIDLETLSTASDAVITQIGLCAFDPYSLDAPPDEFKRHIVVNPQDGINKGLRVDYSTIHWWMMQSAEARVTMPLPWQGLSLSDATIEVERYFNRVTVANNYDKSNIFVWANGASFDLPTLGSTFRAVGLGAPWAYNRELDVRTLKWIAPTDVFKPTPEVAHDALSDAVAQAIWVQNMLLAVKRTTNASITPTTPTIPF